MRHTKLYHSRGLPSLIYSILYIILYWHKIKLSITRILQHNIIKSPLWSVTIFHTSAIIHVPFKA